MLKAAEYFRSLSFGGLAGGAVAGLLFLKLPQLFPAGTDLQTAILLGSVVGTVAHRFIEVVVVKSLLHPLAGFIVYYRKLVELAFLKRLISEQTRKALIEEITVEHFLGVRPTRSQALLSVSAPAVEPPAVAAVAETAHKDNATDGLKTEKTATEKVLQERDALDKLSKLLDEKLTTVAERKDENTDS